MVVIYAINLRSNLDEIQHAFALGSESKRNMFKDMFNFKIEI